MKIFSGSSHPNLANRIAQCLGTPLGAMTCGTFADGEIKIQIEESARGSEVFLIQPTCRPVNDNLIELFVMIDAFKRASVSAINVVIPYYAYARQDKKVKPRQPITAKLVADLIQTAGATRVITCDVHSDQFSGFFDIPVDNLQGGPIIGKYFKDNKYDRYEDLVIVSPDASGVSRTTHLANFLNVPIAIIAKRRPADNVAKVVEIIGNVKGKTCIMLDDMGDTLGTAIAGANALMERGAREVILAVTHAILSKDAVKKLEDSCIKFMVCLDTVPTPKSDKLVVLSSAELFAEAIRRSANNESIGELFEGWR